MALRLQEARLLGSSTRKGEWDWAPTCEAYADAFAWYGLDLDSLNPAEAAERVRNSSVGELIAAALDDWAFLQRGKGSPAWRTLLTISRAADPDPWRCRLRDALESKDPKKALEGLAASARGDNLPPATAVLLARLTRGRVVAESNVVGESAVVDALKQVQRRHPGDFWINYELGGAVRFLKSARPEDAIRYDTAAVALRPQSSAAHNNLGAILQEKGQLDEAIAEYQEAIRLKKDDPKAHTNLGAALHGKGRVDEAIAEYREALLLNKDYPLAHNGLGAALGAKGQLDEAIAEWREAIRLNKDYPEPHTNLGHALQAKGQLNEAIAEFREALRLNKDFFPECHHFNLGPALEAKGQLDEAIAEYREAIRLNKDYSEPHDNLGRALQAKGKLEEAIAHFHEAVRLAPKQPLVHNNLAWLLANCPDPKFRNPPEAVLLAKRAVYLAPQDGNAWNTLGAAFYRAGDWQAAVDALNKSMELRQGDSFDWFLLAMAHWRLDKKEQAKKTFLQAVAWMEKNNPQDKELLRFREEAAALLKTETKPNDNPK